MRMGKDAGRGGDGMLKLVRYKTGGASNEDQQRKNLLPLRPVSSKMLHEIPIFIEYSRIVLYNGLM